MITIPRRAFIAEKVVPRVITTPEMSPERSQKVFLENSKEFDEESPQDMKYMFEYLTIKCSYHCDSSCLFSHQDEPLRRKPFRLRDGNWSYKPQQCLARVCEFRDKCLYAHNTSEVMYHPMLYKTTSCSYKLVNSECIENGTHCPLAHGNVRKPSSYSLNLSSTITHESTLESQIEANKSNLENYSTYKFEHKSHLKIYDKPIKAENFSIETFKTRFCDKKFTHDERTCTFYHNALDKRRKNIFSTEPCKNVFDSGLGIFSDKVCENGDACKNAHTKIEVLYHEDNYKKSPCTSNPCELGEICPNIHQESNLSLEEQKKELNSLVEQHSLLSAMLQSSKEKILKLKKFVCVGCEKPGSGLMHCGHIICSECTSVPKCPVCNIASKKIKINLYNR